MNFRRVCAKHLPTRFIARVQHCCGLYASAGLAIPLLELVSLSKRAEGRAATGRETDSLGLAGWDKTFTPVPPPLMAHPSSVMSPQKFSITANDREAFVSVRLHTRASDASRTKVANCAPPQRATSGAWITVSATRPVPTSCTRFRTTSASRYLLISEKSASATQGRGRRAASRASARAGVRCHQLLRLGSNTHLPSLMRITSPSLEASSAS